MDTKSKTIFRTTGTAGDWQGIKSFTDYKTIPQSCDVNTNFLNQLNNYFGLFEALNSTSAAKATPHHEEQVLCLDPAEVCRTLRRINPGKSAGPDQIPGCVLKESAEQFIYLFMSLQTYSTSPCAKLLCHPATKPQQSSRFLKNPQ